MLTHTFKDQFNDWLRLYRRFLDEAHINKLQEIMQPDYPLQVGFFEQHPTEDTNPKSNAKKQNKKLNNRKNLHKYGEFGWVSLTDIEYQKLIDEYGEKETKTCIACVDELAEMKGNKYKWKNFYLVVRKCHREQWHKSNSNTKEEENHAGYDMAEFESRANKLPVYKANKKS